MVPANALAVLGSETPIAGDPGAAKRAALFVGDVANDCVTYSAYLQAASQQLSAIRAQAATVCRSKLDSTLQGGSWKLRASATEATRGFSGYASAIDEIHRRAHALLHDVEGWLATIRLEAAAVERIAAKIHRYVDMAWDCPPAPVLPTPELDPMLAAGIDLIDEAAARRAVLVANEDEWRRAVTTWIAAADGIRSARAMWEDLVAERRGAEQALRACLQSTALGQLVSLGLAPNGSGPQHTIAHGISGELWGEVVTPVEVQTAHPLLAGIFVDGDAERAWDTPPDPGTVAAWWQGLDATDREQLVRDVPWVIGNLPGLPFAVRDRANRTMIGIYATHPTSLSPDQLSVAAQVQDMLRQESFELQRYGSARPPIQVVALDLVHQVPRVAIGYGDSDTASHTTWAVPGMESDAHLALNDWNVAARNLYAAQNEVFGYAGANSVISWLSYDTPAMVDVFNANGVLSPNMARLGAERLAAELDGHVSARTKDAPSAPSVHVLAHSYGTTTATIALTRVRHSVSSLTLIGSAGLDTTLVPSYGVLNVAESEPGQPAIYATHASADQLAPTGAGLARRGQPHPAATGALGVHMLSPVYEGGLSFSSEGDASLNLRPTDGHSLIGERAERSILGVAASAGHGYLDRGTQSLDSVSRITTGRLNDELAHTMVRSHAACVRATVAFPGLPVIQRVACE